MKHQVYIGIGSNQGDRLEQIQKAIQLIGGRAKTEASGNITLERLPSMRNLGLDYISSGALTHSAKAIDIGLDILPAQLNA